MAQHVASFFSLHVPLLYDDDFSRYQEKHVSVVGKVDLHFHTEYSGDSFIPSYAIIPAAERLGLRAVAKADHDSVSGCTDLLEAARGSSVEYIPAVELSTAEHFHILGYFIDPENAAFVSSTEREKQYGRNVLRERLLHWQENGAPYHDDIDSLIEIAKLLRPHGEISMKQISLILVGMGVFPDDASARADIAVRTLAFTPPAHTPPTAADAVKMIARAGGVAVAAHPKRGSKPGDGRPDVADIERLIKAGIVGVECFNQKVMAADEQAFWSDFCRERNLVATGGTDWHGYVEEWNVILETVTPYDAVKGLKSRLRSLPTL
jgi:hypothetical protein